MFIKRALVTQALEAASEFPVLAIMGPRQSGKTTLAQTSFPHHRYISLEDLDLRALALADPRRFLNEYPSPAGIILDEIQHAPHLLSYMQTIVDREKKKGYFIVTGSQNFLIDEVLTQSLAGRMAALTLLPLSINELEQADMLPARIETLIYKGSYPRAHAEKISIERLYANYIRLYVERDVRQIKQVSNLATFQKFMRLCAGRIGQEVNLTSLATDCGITHPTVKAWLSLLESSYIIYLLYPYYKNFGKRLIKSPKLYFIDTGIACSLLKIRSAEELSDHYLRGSLIESCILADLLKQQYNLDQQPSLYFWRDLAGHELDCIIDTARYPIPIEIKGSKTVTNEFFKGIEFWKKVTNTASAPPFLIYAGSEDQKWPMATVLSWHSAGKLVSTIAKPA